MSALPVVAQEQAPASALPAIKPLGKVVARSAEPLGAVSQVRALPDGRVLVNDNLGRKVVLLDAGLTTSSIVADTTSATANAYSSRAAGLIAYRGDSTLFVDPASLSMLVIDPKGVVARVMSVPRPNEAGALIGGPNGTPGFDAQGRLVYRGPPNMRFGGRGARGGAAATPGAFPTPEFPDSVAVVRIDLASRKVDTAGHVRIPKQNVTVGQSVEGRMSVNVVMNPMPVVDDWAVTSDGRVAIVRGRDYRVDWIGADGMVAGSHKIPFAWRQLNDSMKVAFIDSTRAAMEKLREQALRSAQNGGAELAGMAAAAGFGGMVDVGRAGAEIAVRGAMIGGDGPRVAVRGGDGAPGGAGPGGRGAGGGLAIPPIELVSASDLPDYAPPFAAGSVRGDADGNLWIRTSNVYGGGSVYDVVNAAGKLTDRILLPAGRVIAGFGPGGVVYMGVREADGVRLEKASIR